MTQIDDAKLFEEAGYKLDAMIMTSFTEFDGNRILRYLGKAGSALSFNWNRMWLFQCNPVNHNRADNHKSFAYRRIFKPNCKLNGTSLTCKECLKTCISEENGLPKKVFHPKVWLLRFMKKENHEMFWKLIVSSKNMSKGAENLVDCYFYTKSSGINENSAQENDLTRMLGDLKSGEGSQNELDWEGFDSLLSEVKTLTWEQTPNFLYVNGESWDSIKNRLPWSNKTVEEMRVLSPFLSRQFVSYLYKVCKDTKIYSKSTGFSSLSLKNYSDHQKTMFEVKYTVGDKERDWHAKIFVWKMDGKWYMLLGSLNATKKAFTDNTEFGVWFEIAAEQVPEWEGGTPKLSLTEGDETDEHADRAIDMAFSETAAKEITAIEQQVYKEEIRKAYIEKAKDEILKCIESSADEIKNKDFESALLCKTDKELDFCGIAAEISKIDQKYDELQDDGVWKQYIGGCLSLVNAMKGIKEHKNATN